MTVETPPRTEGAEPSSGRLIEGPTRGRAVVRILVSATLLAASVMTALGVASLLLAITGQSPADVLDAMIEGSVGSTPAIVSSLNHAALVLAVAVGACIAFRAGLVNIGLEGQLTIGGLAGAAVGLALPFDGVLAILIILVSAALGGALWVLLPAFLKYVRGVSEVVTTLLLNFVAFQLVSFMVNRSYLLQEHVESRFNLAAQPQSDRLPEGDRLPAIAEGVGYRLHVGIVVAVVLALVVAFLIIRSRWGLRLRTFGFNPRVAERVGVRPAMTGGGALLLSGAFAGLAGGFLLTGVVLRIQGGFSSGVYGGFSNNYGWEGLLAALVARYRPLYAIAVAVFFGGLRAGGGYLAATGVSVTIVGVVQALVVLAVTVTAVLLQGREQARQRELTRERT
jgi:simple sugar transport system permease protein